MTCGSVRACADSCSSPSSSPARVATNRSLARTRARVQARPPSRRRRPRSRARTATGSRSARTFRCSGSTTRTRTASRSATRSRPLVLSADDTRLRRHRSSAPRERRSATRASQLVAKDLDQGRPTLVQTHVTRRRAAVRRSHAEDRVADRRHLRRADRRGRARRKLPADPESRSLFRRNHGPKCIAPATENDPSCSAIPGSPKQIIGLYPAEIQASPDFCKQLEAQAEREGAARPVHRRAGRQAGAIQRGVQAADDRDRRRARGGGDHDEGRASRAQCLPARGGDRASARTTGGPPTRRGRR